MIDYTYNTSGAMLEIHDEESRMGLLAAAVAQSERSECLSFAVSDVGEHHAGLRISMRVYADNIENPELDRFFKQKYRRGPWLNIVTAHISPRQGKELATAILQAIAMREFDDENEQ